MMNSSTSQDDFVYPVKLVFVGDSGVGKSSLLLRFTSDTFNGTPVTIGVDFKKKPVTVRDKRLDLTIWDTAGQEKFRTLTTTYYREAAGIIFVYDVTRRETFKNLQDAWFEEVQVYSPTQDFVSIIVGNKVDQESEKVVTKEEGLELARKYGCLFIECSAKTRFNVDKCFEELLLKILDTPHLLAKGTYKEKISMVEQGEPNPRVNDNNPGVNEPCC